MDSRLDVSKFTKADLRPHDSSTETLTCSDLVPTTEEMSVAGDRFLPVMRGAQLCMMSREGDTNCKVEFGEDNKIACVKAKNNDEI